MSVRKLLHTPVLSHFPSNSVARAMHAVVVALGACKFEATNPWHDQAVLTRILQTLEACIACPSGRMLNNTDACAVFQSVYRIGFDTQVVQELSGVFPASLHATDLYTHTLAPVADCIAHAKQTRLCTSGQLAKVRHSFITLS